MEESDAEAPQLAPANFPMPSSAPSSTVEAEVRGGGGPSSDGGTEEVTPDSGSNGAGPTSDSIGGEEKPALTPGEALELVFQYAGGYEQYPGARRRTVSMDGSDAPAYYLQTVEMDSISSEYCLDYTGLSDGGGSYQFHLYELVTDKVDGTGHTATMNWIEVSVDSGEITTMF